MDNNEDQDIITYETRNVSFIFPLIIIILSILVLVFSILYYFEKNNYDSIKTKNAEIENMISKTGISNKNTISKNILVNDIISDEINSENISYDILSTLNLNTNDSIKTKNLNITNDINQNEITFENLIDNIKSYNPKKFGYITMSFKCNDDYTCQSVFNPDVKMIYLGNKSQLYHFRNKIPPCVLFDSISDQTIDNRCSSACSERCTIMYNECFSFINENDLKPLKVVDDIEKKFSKIVYGYKKETLSVDIELQSYNPSNSPCFIFTDNTSKEIGKDTVSDSYSELIFKIYFDSDYDYPPYVHAYFTAYNSKTSLQDKKTNKEWKENYSTDPQTFCVSSNLNSFLYENDIFTGDSRINFGIVVNEVTTEYFVIVISNNYGFKFSNSFTFTYLIY